MESCSNIDFECYSFWKTTPASIPNAFKHYLQFFLIPFFFKQLLAYSVGCLYRETVMRICVSHCCVFFDSDGLNPITNDVSKGYLEHT